MIDLGPLNCFLGIYATRDTQGLFLSQEKYALDILHRANVMKCIPCFTPAKTVHKLNTDGKMVIDPTLYCNLAGAMQYLTFTKLNISFIIQ